MEYTRALGKVQMGLFQLENCVLGPFYCSIFSLTPNFNCFYEV